MAELLQTVREGGVGAVSALVVGLLATILGLVAIVSSRGPSGLSLALTSQALAALTAGLGIGGTVLAKERLHAVLGALSPVMQERLLHAGHREAQGASLVGAVAATAPFLLGVVATLVATFFATPRPPARHQGEPSASSSPSLRRVAAVVFSFFAGLAIVGAVVSWRRPLPPLRYALAEDDLSGWALADSVSAVDVSVDAEACAALESALFAYAGHAPLTWPRVAFQPQPPSMIPWKPSAARCVDWIVSGWGTARASSFTWSFDGLLGSPLVTSADELDRIELHRRTHPNSP